MNAILKQKMHFHTDKFTKKRIKRILLYVQNVYLHYRTQNTNYISITITTDSNDGVNNLNSLSIKLKRNNDVENKMRENLKR